MKASLADLTKAYGDHLMAATKARGPSCPPVESLVQCVLGDARRKDRDLVVRHAAACAACAAALKEILAVSAETDRVAADLDAAAGRRTPGRSEARGMSWLTSTWRPAGAILAVSLTVVVLIVALPKLIDRPATRGAAGPPIVLISPVKAQAEKDGLDFKWQGLAAGAHYVVEVFDKEFRPVWRSGQVTGTETRLSAAEAAGRIVPGGPYYWMVTAAAEGRPDVKSKLAEFSVSR